MDFVESSQRERGETEDSLDQKDHRPAGWSSSRCYHRSTDHTTRLAKRPEKGLRQGDSLLRLRVPQALIGAVIGAVATGAVAFAQLRSQEQIAARQLRSQEQIAAQQLQEQKEAAARDLRAQQEEADQRERMQEAEFERQKLDALRQERALEEETKRRREEADRQTKEAERLARQQEQKAAKDRLRQAHADYTAVTAQAHAKLMNVVAAQRKGDLATASTSLEDLRNMYEKVVQVNVNLRAAAGDDTLEQMMSDYGIALVEARDAAVSFFRSRDPALLEKADGALARGFAILQRLDSVLKAKTSG